MFLPHELVNEDDGLIKFWGCETYEIQHRYSLAQVIQDCLRVVDRRAVFHLCGQVGELLLERGPQDTEPFTVRALSDRRQLFQQIHQVHQILLLRLELVAAPRPTCGRVERL